jgi:hypothetical protein
VRSIANVDCKAGENIMAKRMIMVLVVILAMAQAASAQFEEAVPLRDNSGFQLTDAAKGLDGATQGGGPTAALNQSQALKAAAQQLDAASSSGGPTASLNQKIQE